MAGVTVGSRHSGFIKTAALWFLAWASLAALFVYKAAPPREADTSGLAPSASCANAAESEVPLKKNIEDVKVGDYVLAKDPEQPGPPTPHRVVATPRNWTDQVVHVSVPGGGEVVATLSHPFWVHGRGWAKAENLRAGDRLVDDLGRDVSVKGVWLEPVVRTTYNLTVAQSHTYYVVAGSSPILVHNVTVTRAASFDAARQQAFNQSGLSAVDPASIVMSKPDASGTYTQFDGPGGAQVNYDGPHVDMDASQGHDLPHVGWQTAGKRGLGGAERGNITYDGPPGPCR